MGIVEKGGEVGVIVGGGKGEGGEERLETVSWQELGVDNRKCRKCD